MPAKIRSKAPLAFTWIAARPFAARVFMATLLCAASSSAQSLRAAEPARIVNVSSAGQEAIDFTDVMLTRGYNAARTYCQSKLAQVMFTFDLATRLAGTGITATCLHPATYMDTTMVRRAGVTPVSTVEQGAEAILNLAMSPALEGRSGLYFNGLREARAHSQAYDAEARHRLWALSLELAGLARAVPTA